MSIHNVRDMLTQAGIPARLGTKEDRNRLYTEVEQDAKDEQGKIIKDEDGNNVKILVKKDIPQEDIDKATFDVALQEAHESVQEYINESKVQFAGVITDDMLVLYETKARIVKKIDEGMSFDDLSDLDKRMVLGEIAMRTEYNSFAPLELIDVWRRKAHALYEVRTTIDAFQANVLQALATAKTREEVQNILDTAKAEAEAKKAELMGA